MNRLSFAGLAALLPGDPDKIVREMMLRKVSWVRKGVKNSGPVERDEDSSSKETKQRIHELEERIRDYETFMKEIANVHQTNRGGPAYVDPKWVHGLKIPNMPGVESNHHELAIVFDPIEKTFATLNRAILYPGDYIEIPLPRYHALFDVITIFGLASKPSDKLNNSGENTDSWKYIAKARKHGYKRGLKSTREVIITFPLGFLGMPVILRRLFRKITTLHILATRPCEYMPKISAKAQPNKDHMQADVREKGMDRNHRDEMSLRIITKNMLKDLCTTEATRQEMEKVRGQANGDAAKQLASEIMGELLRTPLKPEGEVRYSEAVQVFSELLANSSAIHEATRELVTIIMQDGAAKLASLIEEPPGDTITTGHINTNGQTPLHFAARRGLVNVVEDLVESKEGHVVGLDAPDLYGRTPLILAAAHGHIKVVECLLGRSPTIDARDSRGRTALSWAAAATGEEARNQEIVQKLLDKKAAVYLPDESGVDALSWAANAGNLEIVKILLESGAQLDGAYHEIPRTPLWWAAGSGHLEVVRFLLDHGAQSDVQDQFGRTPLLWAAANGHSGVTQILLQRGADSDSRDIEYGRTPLSWAAEGGHLDVIRTLVPSNGERSINLAAKGLAAGRTPLSYAAAGGHFEAVKFLLDHGADVDPNLNSPVEEPQLTSQQTPTTTVALPSLLVRTPLSWAAAGGYADVVRELLGRCAKLDTRDEFGRTPLWYAAQGGHIDTVRLLLANKADTGVRDFRGKTPRDIAKECGHLGVIDMLVRGD